MNQLKKPESPPPAGIGEVIARSEMGVHRAWLPAITQCYGVDSRDIHALRFDQLENARLDGNMR